MPNVEKGNAAAAATAPNGTAKGPDAEEIAGGAAVAVAAGDVMAEEPAYDEAGVLDPGTDGEAAGGLPDTESKRTAALPREDAAPRPGTGEGNTVLGASAGAEEEDPARAAGEDIAPLPEAKPGGAAAGAGSAGATSVPPDPGTKEAAASPAAAGITREDAAPATALPDGTLGDAATSAVGGEDATPDATPEADAEATSGTAPAPPGRSSRRPRCSGAGAIERFAPGTGAEGKDSAQDDGEDAASDSAPDDGEDAASNEEEDCNLDSPRKFAAVFTPKKTGATLKRKGAHRLIAHEFVVDDQGKKFRIDNKGRRRRLCDTEGCTSNARKAGRCPRCSSPCTPKVKPQPKSKSRQLSSGSGPEEEAEDGVSSEEEREDDEEKGEEEEGEESASLLQCNDTEERGEAWYQLRILAFFNSTHKQSASRFLIARQVQAASPQTWVANTFGSALRTMVGNGRLVVETHGNHSMYSLPVAEEAKGDGHSPKASVGFASKKRHRLLHRGHPPNKSGTSEKAPKILVSPSATDRVVLKTTASKQEFFDLHIDVCEVCGDVGQLLCCATCNLAFHVRCVRPRPPPDPPDSWRCAYCFVAEGNVPPAQQACREMEVMKAEHAARRANQGSRKRHPPGDGALGGARRKKPMHRNEEASAAAAPTKREHRISRSWPSTPPHVPLGAIRYTDPLTYIGNHIANLLVSEEKWTNVTKKVDLINVGQVMYKKGCDRKTAEEGKDKFTGYKALAWWAYGNNYYR